MKPRAPRTKRSRVDAVARVAESGVGAAAAPVAKESNAARAVKSSVGAAAAPVAKESVKSNVVAAARGAKESNAARPAKSNVVAAARGAKESNAARAAKSNVVAAARTRVAAEPGIVAAASLARVAKALRATTVPEPRTLDVVSPSRSVALELVAGRGHYDRVIGAVRTAQTSVWIATANVKELLVEGGRAPGRRRSAYVSILAILDNLAARGVELRLLHAELPSGPFREELAKHPRLVGGGLALRRCPRVHLKTVIVDGALMYLGSANWTGAGLGAKGSGRRNFELGIVTDDGPLLDQVQELYEQIWSGGECRACKLREECPGPLAEL